MKKVSTHNINHNKNTNYYLNFNLLNLYIILF